MDTGVSRMGNDNKSLDTRMITNLLFSTLVSYFNSVHSRSQANRTAAGADMVKFSIPLCDTPVTLAKGSEMLRTGRFRFSCSCFDHAGVTTYILGTDEAEPLDEKDCVRSRGMLEEDD
jgi:hypothetical protein